MVMEMFHTLFPDIGSREYRVVTVTDPTSGLPFDTYGFLEAYCTEVGCDCRNVLLNVFGEASLCHLATLNYALDPDGFREVGYEGQVMLDILNLQSEFS
ncbi:hypothetical protein B1A_13671, partial [mine drainage metagenome]